MNFFQYLLTVILLSITTGMTAQESIKMKKENSGVYTVPCEVNGLRLRFILDTGASAVNISLTEATFMLKNGYLTESDIIGTTNTQTADGNINENYLINLREVKIGSFILKNVKAVVSKGLDAPLLLGQSVLDNIGHWSVRKDNLILNDIDPNFDIKDFDELERVCEDLKMNNHRESIIPIIMAFENGENPLAMALFLKYWEPEDGYEDYVSHCIYSVNNANYSDIHQKYKCLRELGYFYHIKLDDTQKSISIFEKIARDESFPLYYRSDAYESLYIYSMHTNPDKANAYAKEALSKEMYDLAMWYCDYCLIENGEYSEAFKIYSNGHAKGNIRCSYALGKGYVKGIWPEKSVVKGINILDKLVQTTAYPDALYVLCDYYWDNNHFKNMLKYAGMIENKDISCIFEAIAYYNLKEYRMALNRLDNINVGYLTRTDWPVQYYGIKGEIYEKGLGCIPDFEKAYECYKSLVEHNAGWGYACLGDLFANDMFEYKDYETAFKYYTLGANNDSGYCCYQLALLYKYGIGAQKNTTMAQFYKRKAQSLGIDVSNFDD